MESARVQILMPVFNREDVTERMALQLSSQTSRDFRLILIDDGCTDETVSKVKSVLKEQVEIIETGGGKWWAGSLQHGLNFLNNEKCEDESIILIMNDDILFNKSFIENLLNLFENSICNVVSAIEKDTESKKIISKGVSIDWKSFQFNYHPDLIQLASTRAIGIKYKAIKTIGGFHTLLLPHYLSDYEYTYRLTKAGYPITTDESFEVFVDADLSGVHSFSSEELNLKKYLEKIFSKKFSSNPIYFSFFILKCCPSKYLLKNLYRIWRPVLGKIYRKSIGRVATS